MRTRRLSSAALAAGLVLVMGSLAGCGSSDNGVAQKLPKEILAAATQAAQEAGSVHVVSQSSQGPLKSSLDLRIGGHGGRGTVSFVGLDIEVIRIGQTIYVKGNKAFYARLEVALGKPVHVPAGAWLKASAASGPLAQLAAYTDMSGELDRLLSTPGAVTKGAKTTVKGQRAITLKEKTKVYEGALYVASSGKPYPIEQVKGGKGRERGWTRFSDWDRPVTLSPPVPAVDITSLPR